MQKILILTAGFGNGHNAAAFGLRDGLEATSENVQVEVLDLFKTCYGKVNDWVTRAYLGMVGLMPRVWAEVYHVLDKTSILEHQMGHFTRLKDALEDILKTSEPDAVISTHPAYNYVIEQIYKNHSKRPFSQLTVVTDSITVNSVWYASPSDYYFVPNPLTADVMIRAGVPKEKILSFGFPVSPRFRELAVRNGSADSRKHLVYIINTGKKKAGRIIDKLLELPDIRLTITCGADPKLKGKLMARTESAGERVRVLGWTSQMPEILCSSDLVITKAGGAVVQEAIAAGAPLIINQVIPGQEEGNARLVEELGIGAVAIDDEALLAAVHEALEDDGQLLSSWKKAVDLNSHPDASLRIAEFVLRESDPHKPRSGEKDATIPFRRNGVGAGASPEPGDSHPKSLLCDFHTHTKYSDGKLTVTELVDFYGVRGFDCVCITDHLAEKKRLVGKLTNLSNLTLPWSQIDEYFEVIEREKKRAWKKYSMIVMTGLEFNKDGWSKNSSAHLLGIDLKAPINPDHDLKTLIHLIHAQGGLAVASHPHEIKSVWGRNTLYLWENQEEFVPLIDAWEIANRDDIFNPVGLKRLPFLANSDFHKPKHIYSWKTLLNCEKHPEAVKQCIRQNRDISITLYRGPAVETENRMAQAEAGRGYGLTLEVA